MHAEHHNLLTELLTRRRVVSLAVVAEGRPVVGMLPFAVEPDWTGLVVHVSRLAPHSRGMNAGAPFSALICAADDPTVAAAEIPRLRLEGTVATLARGSDAWSAAKDRYLGRHPDAAVTFTLGDFQLHRLEVATGRLVAGLAATLNLKSETLRAAAAGGDAWHDEE